MESSKQPSVEGDFTPGQGSTQTRLEFSGLTTEKYNVESDSDSSTDELMANHVLPNWQPQKYMTIW